MSRARLVVLFPALAAAAAVASTWNAERLPQPARAVAAAFVAVAFLVGALGARAEIRAHATVALAAAAVTAAGQTHAGADYVAFALAFALASIVALRVGRGAVTARYRGPKLPATVLAVVGSGVAVGLALALPPIARAMEDRIGRYFVPDDVPVGFASRMSLGSTRRMLLSSRIVLRIHGERPEYLRGAVLDSYYSRVWASSAGDDIRGDLPTGPLGTTTTRIVFASGAPIAKPPDHRWLLPPDVCNLHSSSGRVLVDASGIARPARAEEDTIAFRIEGCERSAIGLPPPGPADTAIGLPDMERRLGALADGWTRGARTDREKIELLTRELQRYRYSLEVERDERLDPIVDFLEVHREGHCEMFASALVLLARTQKIPARLVTGYRVTEVSPVGHYAVVRERNAHAWTEVWLEGAWHRWDPTPANEVLARSRPSVVDRIGEAAAYGWDEGLPWVLGALTGVVGLGYYARRWIGSARARLARRGAVGEGSSPQFVTLESALARAGHARPASEPLERFASRIAGAGAPWAPDVTKALTAYAALRYGGIGREDDVARSLERAADQVTSSARATAAP